MCRVLSASRFSVQPNKRPARMVVRVRKLHEFKILKYTCNKRLTLKMRYLQKAVRKNFDIVHKVLNI